MYPQLAVWKDEKINLTKEIFRQINSLVIYLIIPLLSRNFWQKCERVNLRDFHNRLCSVKKREILCQASNQLTVLTVKFTSKTSIWRKICEEKTVAIKFCNFHSSRVIIVITQHISDDFTIIFFSIELNPRKYTRKTR